MTANWTTAPHFFYVVHEVNVSRLAYRRSARLANVPTWTCGSVAGFVQLLFVTLHV